MRQCRCNVLFIWEVNFKKKNSVFPIEKFPSLVLPRSTIILQHLIIQFTLYYLSSGRLREVKNKKKFKLIALKSGRGRLREAVAYKGSKYKDLTAKLLVFWKAGRSREVVATGGSTAWKLYLGGKPDHWTLFHLYVRFWAHLAYLSINVLTFCHKCHALIGYATHSLQQ